MSTIKIKSSTISGVIPSPDSLILGELAINIPDGKLFFKDLTDAVKVFNTARDFTLNPLDIPTETVGNIPMGRYDLPSSSEINLSNTENNFKSVDVEGALNELFTSANNVKSRIIDVIGSPLSHDDNTETIVSKILQIKNDLGANIAAKKITVLPSDDFESLTEKVKNIITVSLVGIISRSGSIPLTANTELNIQLTPSIETIAVTDLCATLLTYVDGDKDFTFIDFDFSDNGRGTFSDNPQVIFNGFGRIDSDVIEIMSADPRWVDEGTVYTSSETVIVLDSTVNSLTLS